VFGAGPGVWVACVWRHLRRGGRQRAGWRDRVPDCRVVSKLGRPPPHRQRHAHHSKTGLGTMSDLQVTASGDDRQKISVRLMVLQVSVAVIFSMLTFAFWYFQVVQNAKFEELAENNHSRTISLRAPRGIMLDRNGKVLVENRSSFTISIDREQTK